MVVMCAWLFDIALSAILNVARFDLGFYLGRIYGLCAASFVLAVLLIDNVGLQAKLARLLGSAAPRGRFRKRSSTPSASACSARSWNHPTTPSSPNRSTAPSPAGTAPPNACSASRRPRRSARASTSSSRRTGATRCATSSNGSAQAKPIEHHETLRVRKDGRDVDVSLSISPIRSASGKIIGVSKIARDITESKRTQQALNQEIEERRRIFETSQRPHPGDRHQRQFHPGQPERPPPSSAISPPT